MADPDDLKLGSQRKTHPGIEKEKVKQMSNILAAELSAKMFTITVNEFGGCKKEYKKYQAKCTNNQSTQQCATAEENLVYCVSAYERQLFNLFTKVGKTACRKEEEEWRNCKRESLEGGLAGSLCTHLLYGMLHCSADAVLSKYAQ